ncbi:MAG: DUF4105 domain-containing protein [Sediminispirochaetaceae bacterium]
MKKNLLISCLFPALFLLPMQLGAQAWAVEIDLSEEAVVSMVTIYPGEALYSMYGHTAIRILDPPNDLDLLYNYGQASIPFDSGFVPRFVSGDLPFILGVADSMRAFHFYREYEDRTIYEQVLNLSAEMKQEVFDYLAENAREENRTYIYDFFFDNCTTRVRDLFEELFADRLHYPEESLGLGGSYREDIGPYLRGIPFVKLGIDLMLGRHADGTVTMESALYLPLQLTLAVEEAELSGRNGFVAESRFIYEQQRPEPQPPAVGPAMIMWLLFLTALFLTLFEGKAPRVARWFDSVLYLLAGLVGCAAALLWAFSGYEMTTDNINLLWAWPTHIAAAVFFLLRIPKGKTGQRAWMIYLLLSSAAAAVVLISSPFMVQNLPAAAVPFIISIILRGAAPMVREKGKIHARQNR